MTRSSLFAASGVLIALIAVTCMVLSADLLRRVVALNLAGSGVFLVLLGIAWRNQRPAADPVPQAMVLTGIVVAVSVTALAVALVRRIEAEAVDDDADEP